MASIKVLQTLLGKDRIEPFKSEGEVFVDVSNIVTYVIPMALRCRFDWLLIESLRYFHLYWEDAVRIWFNVSKVNPGSYKWNSGSRQKKLDEDSGLKTDELPDKYNLEATLPIQKFDIFLNFFLINLLEPLKKTLYSNFIDFPSPFEEFDKNPMETSSFVELCISKIKIYYPELVPVLIEAVKRIQEKFVRKVKPYESTMKVLDQVSFEFLMQVFRLPEFVSGLN